MIQPFVVVDRASRVVASAPGTDVGTFEPHLPEAVERHRSREAAAPPATVVPVDDGFVLRIADFIGAFGTVFVVTRERLQTRRDPAAALAADHRLTHREREVLEMLLAGFSNREISDRLYIAPTTARDHTKNILRKTGSNKRSGLLAKVIGYDRRRVIEGRLMNEP